MSAARYWQFSIASAWAYNTKRNSCGLFFQQKFTPPRETRRSDARAVQNRLAHIPRRQGTAIRAGAIAVARACRAQRCLPAHGLCHGGPLLLMHLGGGQPQETCGLHGPQAGDLPPLIDGLAPAVLALAN